MIETISTVSAATFDSSEESAICNSKHDANVQDSPYFIKNKLEIFALCKQITNKPFTILSVGMLSMFLLGSMLLKCVSSCLSLTSALLFAIYGKIDAVNEAGQPENAYYVSVLVFAVIATFFALGNIEGSRPLQVVVMFLRFAFIFLMIMGSLYSITKYGIGDFSKIKLFDFSHVDYLVGNVLYATFTHHSISGMIYPLRPQTKLRQTLWAGYGLQIGLTVVHCTLAVIAFGNRDNVCDKFPCKINEIFNISFMSLPVIGPTVQFFPALAIAVFPVLTITLRNNLMQILGFASTTVRSFFHRYLCRARSALGNAWPGPSASLCQSTGSRSLPPRSSPS